MNLNLHIRSENTFFNFSDAVFEKTSAEVFIQPVGLIGRRGGEERGTVSLFKIRAERELGDGKHLAVNIGKREIHFFIGVFKNEGPLSDDRHVVAYRRVADTLDITPWNYVPMVQYHADMPGPVASPLPFVRTQQIAV